MNCFRLSSIDLLRLIVLIFTNRCNAFNLINRWCNDIGKNNFFNKMRIKIEQAYALALSIPNELRDSGWGFTTPNPSIHAH
jgi:hypothetical protein